MFIGLDRCFYLLFEFRFTGASAFPAIAVPDPIEMITGGSERIV